MVVPPLPLIKVASARPCQVRSPLWTLKSPWAKGLHPLDSCGLDPYFSGVYALFGGGHPMVNAGAEGKAPPTPRRRADGLSLPFTMLSPHGATPSPWGRLRVAIDDVGQLFEVQPSALEPWPFRSHLCRYRAHLVPARTPFPPPLEPSGKPSGHKKRPLVSAHSSFLPSHHSRKPLSYKRSVQEVLVLGNKRSFEP